MVDVLNIINTAYLLYKENWRSVITAFAFIFAIAFIFGIINFVVQLPGSLICDENTPFAKNVFFVLLFCVSPAVFQIITGAIEGLITIVVHMAVLKPLDEMAVGKPISSWTFGFINNVSNAILVIILRTVLLGVCFAPFVLALIPAIPSLVASKNESAFMAGGAALLLTLLLGIVLSLIFNFFLTFLEIEIAVGGSGILDAVSNSTRLVLSNFLDVLIFDALWFLIGIGTGIVTFIIACTICLLPLAWLVPPFIVQPIQLLSTVILWRRLKGSG